MAEPLAKIEAVCRGVGRDPATIGITALIGLWFPDLHAKKPSFFDNPLTGSVREIAAAMRGYAELGVQYIMLQFEPYAATARQRLTEALQLYRGMEASRKAPRRVALPQRMRTLVMEHWSRLSPKRRPGRRPHRLGGGWDESRLGTCVRPYRGVSTIADHLKGQDRCHATRLHEIAS